MALRKQYQIQLEQAVATAQFVPFVNSLDNGEVHITQGNQTVVLTYEDIAYLYGTAYPEKSFKCVNGVGVEIPNFATLSDEEREAMWERFPELRPKPESGQQMEALEGAMTGLLSEGN